MLGCPRIALLSVNMFSLPRPRLSSVSMSEARCHGPQTGRTPAPSESEDCLSSSSLLPMAPSSCVLGFTVLHPKKPPYCSPHDQFLEDRWSLCLPPSPSPRPPPSSRARAPLALTGNAVDVLPSDLRAPVSISLQREAWGPMSSAPAWSQPETASRTVWWKLLETTRRHRQGEDVA